MLKRHRVENREKNRGGNRLVSFTCVGRVFAFYLISFETVFEKYYAMNFELLKLLAFSTSKYVCVWFFVGF